MQPKVRSLCVYYITKHMKRLLSRQKSCHLPSGHYVTLEFPIFKNAGWQLFCLLLVVKPCVFCADSQVSHVISKLIAQIKEKMEHGKRQTWLWLFVSMFLVLFCVSSLKTFCVSITTPPFCKWSALQSLHWAVSVSSQAAGSAEPRLTLKLIQSQLQVCCAACSQGTRDASNTPKHNLQKAACHQQ